MRIPNNVIDSNITDRIDQLRKILGQIGSKETDTKANNLAILKLALDAGDHLNAIKVEAGHGKFESEVVKAELKFSIVTARKYMRLAKKRAAIEEQIESGFVLNLAGALRFIDKLDGNTKPPPSKNPYSSKAMQELSASKRAQLSANLPNDIKIDIVQHAVAHAQHSADVRQALLERFLKSVDAIKATRRTTQEHKNAETLTKLAAFIKAYRMPPVRDLMDYQASSFFKKPGIAATSSDLSDSETSDTDDTPGFIGRDPPPTIN